MLAMICKFHATPGYVTIYFYKGNEILWFNYAVNERVRLHILLRCLGIKHVYLGEDLLKSSDGAMFMFLLKEFHSSQKI